MSNSFYPDQARQFVGPDLGPNCLPSLEGYQQTKLVEKELTDSHHNNSINSFPAGVVCKQFASPGSNLFDISET